MPSPASCFRFNLSGWAKAPYSGRRRITHYDISASVAGRQGLRPCPQAEQFDDVVCCRSKKSAGLPDQYYSRGTLSRSKRMIRRLKLGNTFSNRNLLDDSALLYSASNSGRTGRHTPYLSQTRITPIWPSVVLLNFSPAVNKTNGASKNTHAVGIPRFRVPQIICTDCAEFLRPPPPQVQKQ